MTWSGLLPTPNCNLDMCERMADGKKTDWNGKNKHAMTLPQALTSSAVDKYHKAKQAYEMGASIQDLADHYNISRQAMWKILKRRGAVFRPNLRFGEENHFWRGTKASDAAQNKLEQAIQDGEIERQTVCEKCGGSGTFRDGRSKVQAHHPDYEEPLDVVWLCQECHHLEHKRLTRKEVTLAESNRLKALTFLRQGSRSCVSPPPALEREKAQRMTVGSGRRLLLRLERLPRVGASLRTFLDCLVSKGDWYSSAAALTWKMRVTKCGRLYFQLAVKTLPTGGTGFGLLQSPMPSDVDGGRTTKGSKRQGETGLRGQLLPTPLNGVGPNSHNQISGRFRDKMNQLLCTPKGSPSGPDFARMSREGSGGNDLVTQIALLPTPQACDSHHGGRSTSAKGVRKRIDEGRQLDLAQTLAVQTMLSTPTESMMTMQDMIQAKYHSSKRPAYSEALGTNTGMKLHSDFVCHLMGYPVDWLDV